MGAALWRLDLESEFVFVGDAGTTEASGRTRREGLDLEARLQLHPWLWADVDLNLARGEAVDEPEDANEIPLAPRRTSTGGLTWYHPDGLEGGLRYRHVGDRPANEDGSITAEGYTVVDLVGVCRLGNWRLNLGRGERAEYGVERGAVRHGIATARRRGTCFGDPLHPGESRKPVAGSRFFLLSECRFANRGAGRTTPEPRPARLPSGKPARPGGPAPDP